MATPPNNFFAQNVITIPDPVSEPVGQPNVITLDFDTLGITEYSLSCAQFTSYLTYVFLTGATTGTSPTVYLPSTNSLNGQTVMIKNVTPDNYSVQPVAGVQLDAGTYPATTLMALGNTGDAGAITIVANPDPVNSWYITDVYVQL
jgi:hypothetical protein